MNTLNGNEIKKEISSIQNLRMLFFLVGYRNQGESIVILFQDKETEKIIYSIVTDCYVNHHENITINILEKYNVSSLDILCWTHPDLDHSVGLSSIIEKCNENTKFLIPDFFCNLQTDVVTLNNDEKNVVDQIFEIDIFQRKISSISVNPGERYEVASILFSGRDGTYLPMSIFPISPLKAKLLHKFKERGVFRYKNDVSISYILDVDSYYFLLGGDMTNEMIDEIAGNSRYFNMCRFVKVPHHGSYTANNLIDNLISPIDTACMTKMKKKNPNKVVLGNYNNKAQIVALTGDEEHINCNHGIVLYEYNFSKDPIEIEITPFGNAFIYDNRSKFK